MGVVALAACTDTPSLVAPETTTTTAPLDVTPVPTLPLPDGFVLPDTRGVALTPVTGKPRPAEDEPPLPVYGGRARLSGTISGPDGGVGGAVVRLERFVGDEVGTVEVTANGSGAWEAAGLLGGRYRVRAWRTPNLATLESQTTFLAESDDVRLDVALQRRDGQGLQAALDVADPKVGRTVTVRALLTQESVNGNGIVEGVGVAGTQLELALQGGYRFVSSGATATTGGDGFATWQVACTTPGTHGITVSGAGLTTSVTLPACLPADPVSSSSTTSVPTAEDLDVGELVDLPYEGPAPAGTYQATGTGACGTSYEEWRDGTWVRTVSFERSLTFENPTRNWRAAPGAGACSFRRTA
ncbi:MAG: carboxypeptidase-like regulatory domain-containing protein [Acidimicrobiales bacterium]|nr:carboxypeptidase-like regulatory domain-containing protein [Acidimicrobiales bacterium]